MFQIQHNTDILVFLEALPVLRARIDASAQMPENKINDA